MNADIQLRRKVWEKAQTVDGFNPDMYRKDPCGAWIVWDKYGVQDSIYGWQIDHIYPQSKVGHVSDSGLLLSQDEKSEYKEKTKELLWRDDIRFEENGREYSTTEHSIGNLVLLYGNDNSKFSNADFQTKKNIFFETENVQTFKSRHLIHTISVFAHSEWGGEQIARNKKATIDAFNDYYKEYEQNNLQ